MVAVTGAILSAGRGSFGSDLVAPCSLGAARYENAVAMVSIGYRSVLYDQRGNRIWVHGAHTAVLIRRQNGKEVITSTEELTGA
jgi:hypothetical protein